MEKGEQVKGKGVYLGERLNEAGLVVEVFADEDGNETEVLVEA